MAPLPVGKNPDHRAQIPTRVLVVDEEPLIRWAICTALSAEGFEAVPAPDANEARRLASEWPPPRIALIDRRFVDGRDGVVSSIRDVYPRCRMLVMTTGREHTTGIASGESLDTIHKPFDLTAVVRLVSSLAA